MHLRTGMRLLNLSLVLLLLTGFADRLAFAKSEGTASLTARFAEGQTQFHVGEVIPIELTFSATVRDTFDMSTASYDRSGRLNVEQYHVTPRGRDPLHRYYSEGVFMMGGLSSSITLGDAPKVMRADLNGWVAIDHPGRYTLDVTSGRVSHGAGTKSADIELRSNTLDFEITSASPAWQEQQLTSAMSVLDDSGSTQKDKLIAIRKLRFLDSSASIKELVRQLGKLRDAFQWDCIAGLAGSARQKLVVSELQRAMRAPDLAITQDYLFILAKLKFQLEHDPLPAYPEHDTQQQESWRKQQDERFKELNTVSDSLYDQAAALVPTKKGAARAGTVRTLLQRPTYDPGNSKLVTGLPGQEIAAAFQYLSSDEQYSLLSTFWERLRTPSIIPVLEKIVDLSAIPNQMLRDVAFQRLYELDPGAARPRFLAEISNPHIDKGVVAVRAETLGLLPDQTLPQFDQLFVSRLKQQNSRTTDLDAQLIGRYGSKAVLPELRDFYRYTPLRGVCQVSDGLILYFLRTDPDYAVEQISETPSFCLTHSLQELLGMRRWDEVEPAVIQQLNGQDLSRARQAAETLAKYGSPKAEAAMWQRLRAFHQQWEKKADELNNRPGMPFEASEAMGFEYGLVESIGKAQGWLLSNDQITELANLALGDEQTNVQQWHWTSPVKLTITLTFDNQLMADIDTLCEISPLC